MITLDQALDTVSQLPLEQREMLAEILHKRQITERRQAIARDAQEAVAAFRRGDLKAQPVEQGIAELRQSLDDPGEP